MVADGAFIMLGLIDDPTRRRHVCLVGHQNQATGGQNEETDRPGDDRTDEPDDACIADAHADFPGRAVDMPTASGNAKHREGQTEADADMEQQDAWQGGCFHLLSLRSYFFISL